MNLFNLEYLKYAFATSKRRALGPGRVTSFFCLHVSYSIEQDHIPLEASAHPI